MQRHRRTLLPSILLLVVACSDNEFPGSKEGNHLSFDGRQIEIESVYCSDRMGRVAVRFEYGALHVSERVEPPGYEVALRITAPERGVYVNRKVDNPSTDLISTAGLHLDPDRGVYGTTRLVRSLVLLNPDRFPDAVARELKVRAVCPN